MLGPLLKPSSKGGGVYMHRPPIVSPLSLSLFISLSLSLSLSHSLLAALPSVFPVFSFADPLLSPANPNPHCPYPSVSPSPSPSLFSIPPCEFLSSFIFLCSHPC